MALPVGQRRHTSSMTSYNLQIGNILIKSLTTYTKQMLVSIHTPPPITLAHTE